MTTEAPDIEPLWRESMRKLLSERNVPEDQVEPMIDRLWEASDNIGRAMQVELAKKEED